MLTLLGLWLALAVLARAAGLPWLRGSTTPAAPLEWWNVTLASIWVGTGLIGWVFFVASLAHPLSGGFLIAVWVAVAAAAMVRLRSLRPFRLTAPRSPSLALITTFAALAVVLAERSTWIGNLNDTGGYHWNIVQWLNQHGVVPGLGLFQARLATSSSWLALTAALNAGVLQERVLGVANGVLLLTSMVWLSVAFLRIARGSRAQSDWFLVAGFLLLLPTVLRWEMRLSPSPDIPVLLAPIVMCWWMMWSEETGVSGTPGRRSLEPRLGWILFGAVAVTIKLNAIPLLLVATIAYLAQSRDEDSRSRRFFAAGLVIAVILLPLVASSLVLSGCVLFPSPVGCFDWSTGIGGETAREVTAIIRQSAPWDVTGLLLVSLASLALLLPRVRKLSVAARWTVVLFAVAVAFLLTYAPTSRFGRGYLLLMPALAIAAHREWIARHAAKIAGRARRATPAIAAVIVVLMLGGSLYKDRFHANQHREDGTINAPNVSRWLVPNRLRYDGPFRNVHAHEFDYAVALEGTCWNHPIPCVSTPGVPFMHEVRLRRPELGFAGGFVRATGGAAPHDKDRALQP